MSHVRKLWIEGPAGRLEAALRVAPTARAAVLLAHPHPLHGGTLHNPVVFHSDRALNRAGMTTLRINFRGVGTSDGEHDGGAGETDDLASAARWLRGLAPSVPLLLVGYSFGSLCCLQLAERDDRVAGIVAIALPVRTYPFESLDRLDRPLVVVQGSDDELASPDDVRRRLEQAGLAAGTRVVEGASHLFPARAEDAAREVVAAIESFLPAPVA